MTRVRLSVWPLALAVALGAAIAGCGDEGDDTEKPAAAEEEPSEEGLPEGLTPEQAAKVVAKVGEREITVGDVTEQINRLSPYIRRRWATPEKRKEFLQKLIRVELLSQEAERLGLADEPEVQRTVKQVMIRLMVKNDLEKNLLPSSVPEAELEKQYEEDKDKYHRPAQVRASQIVLKTREEAEKLIADLVEHDEDRRYFREKAKEVSIDEETKERGGDLGYFSRPGERRDDEPEVPAAVAEVAWSLERVGDVHREPVETDEGFHVIKLTNKKPEMNRSFDSVKRLIENRLLREARRDMMDKFIEDLRAKAKIEIFDENLAKVEIKPDPPGTHSHGSPLSGDIPDPKKPAGKQDKAPEPGDKG